MSAKKAAPKRAAPSETEDEVQFIRSSKRQAATALASSSKKKSKASESTPKVSPLSSSDPAKVLANLNTGVSFDPGGSAVGGSSASIQFIQSDLLQVTRFSFLFLSVSCFFANDLSVLAQAMSQLFHLGERMGDHDSLKADLAELTSKLREEKDNVLAM